jgi:dolichyl-phosphate beta-glucosyltransferase
VIGPADIGSETERGMSPPYVSLVIPVYNAEAYIERSIEAVLAFFTQQRYAAEIIVVDDGSTDGTRVVLDQFKNRVHILANSRNMGKGYSVRRGMLAAAGQFVFFTDADIPFTMAPIPRFLNALDGEGCDVVIGSRDPGGSAAVMNLSWPRRAGSHIFTLLVSRMIVPGISDTQCGLKGFRHPAARMLFSRSHINRFAFDVEVLFIAMKKRLGITSLPVQLLACAPSTVRPVRDGIAAAMDLLLMQWRRLRGWYD